MGWPEARAAAEWELGAELAEAVWWWWWWCWWGAADRRAVEERMLVLQPGAAMVAGATAVTVAKTAIAEQHPKSSELSAARAETAVAAGSAGWKHWLWLRR